MLQQPASIASSRQRKKAKNRKNVTKQGPDGLDVSDIQVETLAHLNENQIYLSETKSKRAFNCQVCGLHLISVGASLHHARQPSHHANLLSAHVKQVLLHLPPITDVHRTVLNCTLESALKDVLVNASEIQRRQRFANQVISALRQRVPNLKLTRVGSTWTGLVLPDSDVNLDVSYQESSEDDSNPVRISAPRQDLPQTLIVPNDSVMRSPGLGYLLVKVFEVLKTNARGDPPRSSYAIEAREPIQDEEQPVDENDSLASDKFPEIYSVIRTDAEHFSISFSDSHDVYYRLTTESPHGDLQAELIRTYLGLHERALQLATLFRKLAKLAHLDMPLNGTFSAPVLSILVIFYLQHCDPPVLPNLHALYRKHHSKLPPGSYREVYYCDEYWSYLIDPALIRQYWDAELMEASSSSVTGTEELTTEAPADQQPKRSQPDLADLWLGLLRFYLFDFQRAKCTVNIVESKPVLRKGDGCGLSTLVVTAPFDPRVNLCKSIGSCGFQYIFSQLLACYGYFGVPRLTTGRHVFTNVRVHEDEPKQSAADSEPARQRARQQPESTTPDKSGTKANQVKGPAATSTSTAPPSVLHFTPIIDDTNEFSANLLKIHSLCVEKFASERDQLADENDRVQCINDEGIDETSESTVPLFRLVPHLLRVVLDEILDSEDVPTIADRCLEKFWRKLEPKVSRDFQVSLTELIHLCNAFAKPFWAKICQQFINKGLMTVSTSEFVKNTIFSLRSVTLRWSLEFGKRATTTSGQLQTSVANDADTEPRKVLASDPVDDCSDTTGIGDVHVETKVPDTSKSDDDSDTQYQDAEDQMLNDTRESGPDDFDEDIGADVDDNGNDLDLNSEDEVLNETCESGVEHHELSITRFGDETEDGACEYAERTLDLGDDEDLAHNEDEDDNGSGFLTTQQSQKLGVDTDALTRCSDSLSDQMFRAVEALKGSEIPHGDSTNNKTQLSKASSGSRKQIKQEKIGSDAITATAPTDRTKQTALTSAPKRPRRSKDATRKSADAQLGDETAGNLTRGRKSSDLEKWSNVIRPRSSMSKPIDDERPDYYHSKLVQSLHPEDLSFPFTAWGQLSHLGGHVIRSSVLGLTAMNQPSTMLAHFTCPEPQCKACGQVGHRMATCKTAIDKSVSFVAWQKHRSETPRLPPPGQIQALSDCLLELASFHDCSVQMEHRKNLVDGLEKVFASRFPSVMLKLFGSCANGFELPSSDMDLCVFFPRDSPQWHQLQRADGMLQLIGDFKRHLYRLSQQLHLSHIRAILHAKVPILKVRFVDGFEVDISFSNYLALRNTKMLKLYTEIDPGLRVLGIALKVVGKLCHIANASIGGVSSYALIIMLIHYLQQRDQLPVLQELYEGDEKPVILVNGWNAWYQEDKSVINRLWKPPQQKPLLGDLWLGFFYYYLFEFDRDVNVVSIRQKAVLTRFVKMWTSLFAVEDPFNLEHNLTGGLCRDSFLCVLDVFYAVLLHHTTFIPLELPIRMWRYLLFCPQSLAEKRRLDAPAKSRCNRCRQCGHRAADCPLKDRFVPRSLIETQDASIQALIGPFLRGELNTQQQPHAPPPAHYSGQTIPAHGHGPMYQPYALLPTPGPFYPNRHMGASQSHVMFVQNSYAGFGQPQVPYSHNRFVRPQPGQYHSQQQQPPPQRIVLYNARAHAQPRVNRPVPINGPVRQSVPRSVDQTTDYPNHHSYPQQQQHPTRGSTSAQFRHPHPPPYSQQQQQPAHRQGNLESETSKSHHPGWADNAEAYSHHFPPPPTHQSQRPVRPNTNELHNHPQQKQESVRFTNPVNQSTPTKPVQQSSFGGSLQQGRGSKNNHATTPKKTIAPNRNSAPLNHSGPRSPKPFDTPNPNNNNNNYPKPTSGSKNNMVQSNNHTAPSKSSRRRGRFTRSSTEYRNADDRQNETAELTGRLQRMSTQSAATGPR